MANRFAMGLGLQYPGLDFHNKKLEEGKELKEYLDEYHLWRADAYDEKESLAEWVAETQDFYQARMDADLDLDPNLKYSPTWSRLEWGKIYKDGFFEEKMFRDGDWKDYRWGKTTNNHVPEYKLIDLMNLNCRAGLPDFNFIKAQKRPQVKENRHLRYMRRFSKLNRENVSIRNWAHKSVGWSGEEKKRTRKNDLPSLHPRVEQALGAMFHDMARTRHFGYDEVEKDD